MIASWFRSRAYFRVALLLFTLSLITIIHTHDYPIGEARAKRAILIDQEQQCYPGSGWVWTYGPFRPEVASKVQQALEEIQLETSVEARSYGETDSCGDFELYALDFTITVQDPPPLSAVEQNEIASRVYPILIEYGKPHLGHVKLNFSATGETLELDQHLEVPGSLPPVRSLASPSDVGLQRKVMVVVFDPLLSNGQTLSEYMNWYDHAALTQGIIDFFQQASNSWMQYTVVETAVISDSPEGWPLKIDGFRYTESEYLSVMSGYALPHNPDTADYNRILSLPELDICGKLNRGEIDELWMYGGPYFGYYESRLAGPGAYWYNSPPVPGPTGCNRLLPIMGFNYERELTMAVEDFGHRTESTMVEVYEGWQQNRTSNNWERFALVKAQSPDYFYSGCGSVHYPPNGVSDYNYSNPAVVLTNCDDFLNYPNLGDPVDTVEPITCSGWSCTHFGYFAYWFRHLPMYYGCGPDEVANSWWTYIADPALALDPLTACDLSPGVRIEGPATGVTTDAYSFTAVTSPISATLPITYTWRATDQSQVIHLSNDLNDTISYTWSITGTKTITVTAAHSQGTEIDVNEFQVTDEIVRVFQIDQGSDDAGPSGLCDYSTSWNEIYFGQCPNGQAITSGFRFANVTIPRRSQIHTAYIEFTVDGMYHNQLSMELYGEATANALTFDITDKPKNRPLTSASTFWSILASDVWVFGQPRKSPELAAIIQEIVDQGDWRSGNALAIIAKNAGPSIPPNEHRRVYAFEREPVGEQAARLVVAYSRPALQVYLPLIIEH